MALRRSVTVFAGWTFSLLVGCILLTGCGGGAPPPKAKDAPKAFSKADFAKETAATKSASPDQAAVKLSKLAISAFEANERESAKEAMAEAVRRLKELTEEEPPPTLVDTWSTSGAALYKVGMRDDARTYLKKAGDVVAKIEKGEQKAQALAKLATAQNSVGMANEAAAAMKQAEGLGPKEEDPQAKLALLGYVATGYQAIGKGADAERIVTSMLEVANAATEPELKARFLATVASTQAAIEKRDPAGETFKQAREAAESVKDPLKKVFTMFDVGEKMMRSNFKKSGREVLETARSNAMTLESLKTKQAEFKVMYEDIGRLLK
jgi:tetratricopeptide (TPR) repeat protein